MRKFLLSLLPLVHGLDSFLSNEGEIFVIHAENEMLLNASKISVAGIIEYADGSTSATQANALADAEQRMWRADESLVAYVGFNEALNSVFKDSTMYENHMTVQGSNLLPEEHATHPQFSRAVRWKTSIYDSLMIKDSPSMSVHEGESFSVSVWANYANLTYPRSTIIMKHGQGCYFAVNRTGATRGWDIGHGGYASRLEVCIRDTDGLAGPTVHSLLDIDPGFTFSELLNTWAHYAIVFDRNINKVSLYINGVKQSGEATWTGGKGSLTPPLGHDFTLGSIYGWQTEGAMDEFRFYKRALSSSDVAAIYRYRPPMYSYEASIKFSEPIATTSEVDIDVSAFSDPIRVDAIIDCSLVSSCRKTGFMNDLNSTGSIYNSNIAEYCDTGGGSPVTNTYSRILTAGTTTLRLFATGETDQACGAVIFNLVITGS